MNKIIKRPTFSGNAMILVLITLVFYSFLNKTDSVKVIDKTLFEHKITNTVLKKHIERYDSIYGNYNEAKDKAIRILYFKEGDTHCFSIGYLVNIPFTTTFILCEPINGKQVVLVMYDLVNYFKIPERKAVEILKESNPNEYEVYIKGITDTLWIDGGWHIPEPQIIFSHFVGWTVKFDRYGNFMSAETPVVVW